MTTSQRGRAAPVAGRVAISPRFPETPRLQVHNGATGYQSFFDLCAELDRRHVKYDICQGVESDHNAPSKPMPSLPVSRHWATDPTQSWGGEF